MNDGTGFGGEATDYNSLAEGLRRARERRALHEEEACNFLKEAHQALQYALRDALWLVTFMESPDKMKLVDTLKHSFLSLNVNTEMSSSERELLRTACQVCNTLAMDVQLATVLGSSQQPDSLYSIIIKFCLDAEYILSRSGNSQMNDVLLISQVAQLKDSVKRTVDQLEPFQEKNSINSQSPSMRPPEGLENYYKNELGLLRFDLVESLQHYALEEHVAPNPHTATRQWFKELAAYKSTLPIEYGSCIFVRAMEQQLSRIRVMILGPDNTPYALGVFMFDVFLPPSYPQRPPKVKFLSTGNGKTRFNPNLYADGKVCLSLLGTWSGPSWIPGTSTLLQVLISIQSLILVPDPYFNEPGYEAQRGTKQGERKSTAYNKSLRKQTSQLCILNVLEYLVVPERNPYREFQECMVTHFLIKKHVLKDQMNQWRMWDSSLSKVSQRIFYLLERLDDQYPDIARSFDDRDANVATLPVERRRGASTSNVAANRRHLPFAQTPRRVSDRSIVSRNSPSPTAIDGGPLVVAIPDHVSPGDTFEALVKGQITKFKCPSHGEPGRKCAVYPCSDLQEQTFPAAPSEEAKVCKIGGMGYIVTVPRGVSPGKQFHVKIKGKVMAITCPAHGRPGAPVKIFPNMLALSSGGGNLSQQQHSGYRDGKEDDENEDEIFTATIPHGVQPGHHFTVNQHGIHLLLKCPQGASAGEVMRYRISMHEPRPRIRHDQQPSVNFSRKQRHDRLNQDAIQPLPQRRGPESYGSNWQSVSTIAPARQGKTENGNLTMIRYPSVALEYVRVLVDDKFYWNRASERDFESRGYDMATSAYGRKLVYKNVVDGHRAGDLSMVTLGAAVIEASVKLSEGTTLISSKDIAEGANKSTFETKVEWFRNVCVHYLRVPVSEGFMRITVPRGDYMLEDSVKYVMQLSRLDLRKKWRLGYLREIDMDFSEENQWYQHVLRKIFDLDLGLWQYSHVENELRMQIHPASGSCCDDHLQYFRFGGRILGKALLEGRQMLTVPLDTYILKILVGWPLYFRDIRNVEEKQYHHLEQLDALIMGGEDLSVLGLNFTTTSQLLGKCKEVDLIAGGSSTELTNHNFDLYVEASLRYHLLENVKPQLTEFVLGFFDVIPEALLAVFDYRELEKLIKFPSMSSST